MLSPKQQEVYDYILDYYKEHKKSPFLKEIAQGIGYSHNLQTGVAYVSQVVREIEKKGLIKRVAGQRNIRLK